MKNCFDNANDKLCIPYLSINLRQLELTEDSPPNPDLCCDLKKPFLHKLQRCLAVESLRGCYS